MPNQAAMANPADQVETVIAQLDKLAAAVNTAKNAMRNKRPEQQIEVLKTYQQKANTLEQTTQFLQTIGTRA